MINLGHLTVLVNHLGCPLSVYLDGRRLTLDVRRLNIDDIPAEEVELAEVYYDGRKAPSRFPGGFGAVLLWSQRMARRKDSGRPTRS